MSGELIMLIGIKKI